VRLKQIIRGPKEDISWGEWRAGHVPRKEFPLSRLKSKVYKIGPSYHWRIGRFSQGGNSYRVWVKFRPDLENYAAVLGLEQSDGDMVVLARYEFHGSHPGWHVHAACKNVRDIEPGRLHSPLHSRMPRRGGRHRDDRFGVTLLSATDKAVKKFRLYGPDTLL
jgi:hypothetical protein